MDQCFATYTILSETFVAKIVGHSEIALTSESTSPWAQAVTLLPSRRASCENAKLDEMDAVFELTAYAILTKGKVQMPLEGVEYKKLFISNYGIGGTYKVGNLQPGREYKIKVRLKCPVCYFTVFVLKYVN